MLPPSSKQLSTPACRRLLSSFLILLLGFVLPFSGFFRVTPAASAAPLVANPTSTIFINEIHYDNTSTDTGEFVEVAGPAGTSLTGYSIVRYNGATVSAYTTPGNPIFSGTIPSQQGGYGTVFLSYPQTASRTDRRTGWLSSARATSSFSSSATRAPSPRRTARPRGRPAPTSAFPRTARGRSAARSN